jgi:hypothetical protein
LRKKSAPREKTAPWSKINRRRSFHYAASLLLPLALCCFVFSGVSGWLIFFLLWGFGGDFLFYA